MESLMSYMTAFGLAGGAGSKAFIPVLLLGGFHYTEYFELSERWQWIASPPVMIVLGVLVLVEIIVDSHQDLGQFSDVVGYLPKLVVGFVAFAAATGEVDQSLVQLSASGLLGSATAGTVHWLRTKVRQPFRFYVEDLHGSAGKAASLSEAGMSAAVAAGSVIAPLVGLVLLVGLVVGALAVARSLDRRRIACVHCGEPIRPGAVVCIHCKREQSAVPEVAAT
jgi:hypothetical protein